MKHKLPVPPELEHLIEKRETPPRRQKKRRAKQDRRVADLGPAGALLGSGNEQAVPATDRRAQDDRRDQGDRRKKPRRRKSSG